eukprot:COSAG01_NODE_70172_length_259_cov_0.768750_1_plen_54_part_01
MYRIDLEYWVPVGSLTDDVSNPEVRLRRELILLSRLVLIVNDTELVALLFDRQF